MAHPGIMLTHADHLLRSQGVFAPGQETQRPWWLLPLIVLAFSPLYGAVMGSAHLDTPERILMILYSAVKVPLLLFTTTLICIPGFFVLNTLLGLREDFRASVQAILAGQAVMSIALAALAPHTRFWYFSISVHNNAILLNLLMFTVAALAGQLVMWRYYLPLIRRRKAHAGMLGAWLILYGFVGIQMGWMLRPFVGSPDKPVSFFRPEPFSNAYVVLVNIILH